MKENLLISQTLFCFDHRRQLLHSLHCFSLLFILVVRVRNVIPAYVSQIGAMKSQRKCAVENHCSAYNGLTRNSKCIFQPVLEMHKLKKIMYWRSALFALGT
jgi:hypothetical protein